MQICKVAHAAPQHLPKRKSVTAGCLKCGVHGLLGCKVQQLPIQVASTCSSSSSSSSDSSAHAASSRSMYVSDVGRMWLSTPHSGAASSSGDGSRGSTCSSGSSGSSSRNRAHNSWRISASTREGSRTSSSSSSNNDLPAGEASDSTGQERQSSSSQEEPYLVDMPRLQANGDSSSSKAQGSSDESESVAVRAALAMLNFYRSSLSPLMQSTCRFLPTCSQYSIDSYKAYGVWKGTVLTAWRLMRCNPWGGSGYDPTTWPPPGLGWLFQYSYTAELAVVLGTAAFLRLGHALLFE